MDEQYERHLPHQVPKGFPIFLTWNLKGAIRAEMAEQLRRERKRLEQEPRRAGESDSERGVRHDKLLFAMTDRFLDHATSGPMHLKDPCAAKTVEDSILFDVRRRYALFAWCVMANHVHVLLTPHRPLKAVMQGIKGFTAHEINGLQGARGRVF